MLSPGFSAFLTTAGATAELARLPIRWGGGNQHQLAGAADSASRLVTEKLCLQENFMW